MEKVAHNNTTSLLDVHVNALLRMTTAIETATTLDELLLLALSETSQFMVVPFTGIILMSPEEQVPQLVNTYPPQVGLPRPIRLEDAPYLCDVFDQREAIQIRDLQDDSPYAQLLRLVGDDAICSVLLSPLVAQDQVIGALIVATRARTRSFTDSETTLLRVMTGPLATAITLFRITEAAQRRNAELSTLNDIAHAITSTLDSREIYRQVVKQLNEYFEVDAGSLLLRDESGDLEFVMTLEEGQEKLLRGLRVPRGQGVAGHVAETQRYEIVDDAQSDPRFYRKIGEDVGFVTKSILCVPMINKGRTIGVIELLNKQNGDFSHQDAERLANMATTISIAIENARLFQQVSEGRDRLEAILNSSNDGIIMTDMRGFVMTCNPVAARLFRMVRGEMLGQNMDHLLLKLHQRSKVVTTPSWLNGGSDSSGISEVMEFELGGAQHLFIRHFTLPVHDARHVEIGQLMIFQDVSKDRELSQLRDDFTGMLVHDLRAPLTAIMNGINMIQRGLGGPVTDQQDNLLNIVYQSSQTMLEMVNTLLDISKMEQGSIPLNYEPISPYVLVDEPLGRLRTIAEDSAVTLKQELPVGLPLVEADREKILRVLQNLLDNAIKFSPSGGTITLGVQHIRVDREHRWHIISLDELASIVDALPITLPQLEENDWMVFWVRDEGEGIAPQYHDRIFEKFGQVRRKRARGTGLGLTFSKLAVESHGGWIWLESEVGEGSTFAFALPLARPSTALLE